MCILKSCIEAAALQSKRKFGPASLSEETCACLNQSNIHVVSKLIYPILDVFQDEMH